MESATPTQSRAPHAPGGGASAADSTDASRRETSREERLVSLSLELLGGSKTLKIHGLEHQPLSRIELHKAMRRGAFSYAVLDTLLAGLGALKKKDVADVLGVSARTLDRQRSAPGRSMPAGVASRTWMLAETMAKASEVFGGVRQAEAWMDKPAMGLDGCRPIEMLQTLQGAEVVNDFLTRLEYGVYS